MSMNCFIRVFYSLYIYKYEIVLSKLLNGAKYIWGFADYRNENA